MAPELPAKKEDVSTKQTSHNAPVPTPHAATQCLFCSSTSPSPTENLHHMSSTHGLFVPRIDRIVDLQCFLAYLGVLVYEYRECMYCGVEKSTVQAVQTHMRDKGHCRIDVAELDEFWDDEEGEDTRRPKENIEPQNTEPRFPANPIPTQRPSSSSKIPTQLVPTERPSLTSSHTGHTQHRRTRRAEPLDTTIHISRHQANITPSSRDLTKSNRDLANLNLPLCQLRSLATLDRRMKIRETSARARFQHKAEQQPVKCMYYKTENPVYQAG